MSNQSQTERSAKRDLEEALEAYDAAMRAAVVEEMEDARFDRLGAEWVKAVKIACVEGDAEEVMALVDARLQQAGMAREWLGRQGAGVGT